MKRNNTTTNVQDEEAKNGVVTWEISGHPQEEYALAKTTVDLPVDLPMQDEFMDEDLEEVEFMDEDLKETEIVEDEDIEEAEIVEEEEDTTIKLEKPTSRKLPYPLTAKKLYRMALEISASDPSFWVLGYNYKSRLMHECSLLVNHPICRHNVAAIWNALEFRRYNSNYFICLSADIILNAYLNDNMEEK